jgi:hypothetical protein
MDSCVQWTIIKSSKAWNSQRTHLKDVYSLGVQLPTLVLRSNRVSGSQTNKTGTTPPSVIRKFIVPFSWAEDYPLNAPSSPYGSRVCTRVSCNRIVTHPTCFPYLCAISSASSDSFVSSYVVSLRVGILVFCRSVRHAQVMCLRMLTTFGLVGLYTSGLLCMILSS